MGFASGSETAEDLWLNIRMYVRDQDRVKVARYIIDAFEDLDCDTIYECEELVKAAELEDKYWPEDES